jgi:hypothetical protein
MCMPVGDLSVRSVPVADMWFDPICPWAWLTSRWLLEAEGVRDVQVQFKIMSLAVLNEGRTDMSDRERAMYEEAWGPVRVATATALSCGPDAVRAFYTEIGSLIHHEDHPINRDLYAKALHRAGLPHTLANAALTDTYDETIRASHHAGVDPLGPVAACPIVHVPGARGEAVPFVGPVVTPYPLGEAAGRLWDAVANAATIEGFIRLQRHLERGPIMDPRVPDAPGH